MNQIKYTVLNKNKKSVVVLIHGLFTNSAFWVNYLDMLNEYKIVLLDIRYNYIEDLKVICESIDQILEDLISQERYNIITHSYGSVLLCGMRSMLNREYFEICPYLISKCIDENKLRNICVVNKIRLSESQFNILRIKNDAKARFLQNSSQFKKTSTVLLPKDDDVFSYKKNGIFFTYAGNHFEISGALEIILGCMSKRII